MSNKDDIRNAFLGGAPTLQTATVKVLGRTITVTELNGTDFDKFQTFIQKRRKGDNIDINGLRAALVALTVVDDEGNRVFGDDDIDAINANLGSRVIKTIYAKAAKLSGLEDDEAQEMLGNSEATPTGDSGSV